MRITSLTISNFRSIRFETFVFGPLNVLIGKNNAGKSNVLAAIVRLLDGTKSDFAPADFHDPAQPITIEAVLTDVARFVPLLDDKNRSKFEACIESDTIRLRKTTTEDYELQIRQPKDGEFGMPSGIAAALKAMLPEVISVQAFVDPVAHADGKDSAVLGKLLKVVMDELRTDTDDAVKASLEQVNTLLNPTIGADGEERDGRAKALKSIEQTLTGYVAETFDGAAARIRVDLPEMKQMLSKARVELKDGTEWDDPALKGQGQQRALYMALLRAWAQHRRLADTRDVKRPLLLLVEEPEMCLHPSAHAVIRDSLEAIAAQTQVFFTTHSPTMVSPAHVAETILIRKTSSGGKPETVRLRPLEDDLQGLDKRVKELFLYPRSSKFLFADKVLVVEGNSDAELIDALALRLTSHSLEDHGYCCIDASDKMHVSACMRVLAARGLLVRGLVDFDFLWRGADALLSADPDYNKFRSRLWADCGAKGLLDAEGHRVKSGHKPAVADLVNSAYVTDAVTTRTTLREAHDIWCFDEGDIESYVGLAQSSKSDYGAAAVELRAGTRAIAFEEELKALFGWLGILPAAPGVDGATLVVSKEAGALEQSRVPLP